MDKALLPVRTVKPRSEIYKLLRSLGFGVSIAYSGIAEWQERRLCRSIYCMWCLGILGAAMM
jgi:hypothetical protein